MFTFFHASAAVYALNNGLGRLPGLGWNSDYCTNCTKSANGFQNEAFIEHIADALVSMGFQSLGFRYVNLDASWDLPERDANGDLVPDPALWPSGIDHTIEYVHSLGLGFGLYGDKGDKDCAQDPGQLGHEAQDSAFFAKHKVDWFKEDSCNSGGNESVQIAAYAKMRDALNATGYPIWFALCGWKTFYATGSGAGKLLGNSFRVGPDTGSGWNAVMENVAAGLTVAAATQADGSGPVGPGRSAAGGAWSDGSLLLTPGYSNGKLPPDDPHFMTNARSRSMFSLWCTLGFNLLLTGNLTALNPFVIETWSNAEAIAINQDALGYPIIRLSPNGSACFFRDRDGACAGVRAHSLSAAPIDARPAVGEFSFVPLHYTRILLTV
jgi:alpha-galactosidase